MSEVSQLSATAAPSGDTEMATASKFPARAATPETSGVDSGDPAASSSPTAAVDSMVQAPFTDGNSTSLLDSLENMDDATRGPPSDSAAGTEVSAPVSPPGLSTTEALLHQEALRNKLELRMRATEGDSSKSSPAEKICEAADAIDDSHRHYQQLQSPYQYAKSNVLTNFIWLLPRLLCTFWVYLSITFFSAVGCFLCVGFRGFQLIRDVIFPISGEKAKVERAADDDNLRSMMTDTCVRAVTLLTHPIIPVSILGSAGRPHTRMGKEEWTSWKAAHLKPDNIRQNVQWVQVPRDDHGDCKLPYGCLLMCNHMSNIDGFVTKASLFPSCSKAIIKSEVRTIPVVGWLVWLSNEPVVHFVKVAGRWTTRRKEETMRRCLEVVRAGFPIIVYPEGARRTMGRMAPFRHGMINFAIEHGCPIYPAVIHGSHRVWPVHSALMSPSNIYMNFADEVIIPRPDNTPEEICEALKGRMLQLLENVPGYDAEAERPFESYAEFKQAQSELKHGEECKKTQ